MKNLLLVAPAILFASFAAAACQPHGDATKANEALVRHGGQASTVTTLPRDPNAPLPPASVARRQQGKPVTAR